VWPVLVAVAVAPIASDAGPRTPRKGKVVRVERPRLGVRGTPRICELGGTTGSLSGARCYGSAPKLDDLGTLVDGEGIINSVRVIKVDSGASGCLGHEIATEPVDGSKDRRDRSWGAIVVFDIPLDAKARKLDVSAQRAPSGKPIEQSWQVLDADGDGASDHVLTVYPCDGSSITTLSEVCFDYWKLEPPKATRQNEWTRLRQDRGTLCRP
jgi:hypothetical protein